MILKPQELISRQHGMLPKHTSQEERFQMTQVNRSFTYTSIETITNVSTHTHTHHSHTHTSHTHHTYIHTYIHAHNTYTHTYIHTHNTYTHTLHTHTYVHTYTLTSGTLDICRASMISGSLCSPAICNLFSLLARP